jgi:hypothetical protein
MKNQARNRQIIAGCGPFFFPRRPPTHFACSQEMVAGATTPLDYHFPETSMYPLVGLLVLILDIYAIYLILQGPGDTGMKLVWILIVLVLPPIGAILYLLLGRGGQKI